MSKKIFVTIFLLFLCVDAFSEDDSIVKYDETSLPVLNESLRRIKHSITSRSYIDDAIDTVTNINNMTEKTTLVDNDLFVIEDSADSYKKKKVLKSSAIPKNLSNLVWSYCIGNVTPGGTPEKGVLFADAVAGTSVFASLRKPQFLKTKDVSTLTWYLLYCRNGGDGSYNTYFKCYAGSLESAQFGGSDAAWTSRTATIDVSSLTNGTVYDLDIKWTAGNIAGSICYIQILAS